MVYEGMDTERNVKVAIKVLNTNKDKLFRVKREIMILQKLKGHPNVI